MHAVSFPRYYSRGTRKIMKAIVVGLPRSGSTLLCRIIHSADDCVCLSEPHLEALSLKTCKTLRDDKISDIGLEVFSDREMPLDEAMSELSKAFKIAAFKETFRPEPFKQWGLFNEDLLKTYKRNKYKVIGIVRSPLKNFNSWKSREWGGWTNDVDVFIESYHQILQFCDGDIIRYEDLLSSPVHVMGKLGITFSELRPMAAEFGDIEALESTSVRSERKNPCVLSNKDINAIDESGLQKLYDSIRL